MHNHNDSGGGPVPPSSTLFLSRPEGSRLVDDEETRRISGPGSAAAFKIAEDAWEDDSDKDTDAGAPEADVIEPLAYRIPCPRSSGGTAKYVFVEFYDYLNQPRVICSTHEGIL